MLYPGGGIYSNTEIMMIIIIIIIQDVHAVHAGIRSYYVQNLVPRGYNYYYYNNRGGRASLKVSTNSVRSDGRKKGGRWEWQISGRG